MFRNIALWAALSAVAGLAQPPKAPTMVNAASGGAMIAPDSIASAFGLQIGASTKSADTQPLPTILNGVSVQIVDAAAKPVLAPLFYVGPNQINMVIPNTVATGMATVKIMNGNATPPTIAVQIAAVAPGIFTTNGAGTGVPAAIAIRRMIDSDTDVPVFHCDANGCSSVPIDLNAGGQVFLALFGTGIRGRTALANVTATIGGTSMQVLFAGAQGQFPGLDQVNVALPQNLTMHGEQDVVLTVDGQQANAVRVNVK